MNLGLNARPTFFGCNGTNVTMGSNIPPLIVYLPNAPMTAQSNTSTFMLSYEDSQTADILVNGWNVATRGNGTLDATWPTCLACAITQRGREAMDAAMPSECADCFDRYCWDGSLNATTPALYEPSLQIQAQPAAAASDCSTLDRLFGRNGC